MMWSDNDVLNDFNTVDYRWPGFGLRMVVEGGFRREEKTMIFFWV